MRIEEEIERRRKEPSLLEELKSDFGIAYDMSKIKKPRSSLSVNTSQRKLVKCTTNGKNQKSVRSTKN